MKILADILVAVLRALLPALFEHFWPDRKPMQQSAPNPVRRGWNERIRRHWGDKA